MAANNTITVTGYVGTVEDLRWINGKNKLVFSLGVKRLTKRDELSDWFRIEVWGQRAESLRDMLLKGHLVSVTGTMHMDEVKGADESKRLFPNISADSVQIWPARAAEGQGGQLKSPYHQEYDKEQAREKIAQTRRQLDGPETRWEDDIPPF